MHQRQVNLKTNEDYLEASEKLGKLYKKGALIDDGSVEVISDKDLRNKIRLEILDQKSLQARGRMLTGWEVNRVYSFHHILEKKRGGWTWAKLLDTVIYGDDYGTNDSFIRVVEIEEDVEIKDYKDIIKAVGKDAYTALSKEESEEEHKDTFNKAMVYRLSREIEEMIDNEATWKDLINIDLKKFKLKDKMTLYGYSDDSDKSKPKEWNYKAFLLETIGFYFHLLDYAMNPLKPRYIVEILEAPREVEFQLKQLFEEGTDLGKMMERSHYFAYLAKEDALIRLGKRERGEEVFADQFSKKKWFKKIKKAL